MKLKNGLLAVMFTGVMLLSACTPKENAVSTVPSASSETVISSESVNDASEVAENSSGVASEPQGNGLGVYADEEKWITSDSNDILTLPAEVTINGDTIKRGDTVGDLIAKGWSIVVDVENLQSLEPSDIIEAQKLWRYKYNRMEKDGLEVNLGLVNITSATAPLSECTIVEISVTTYQSPEIALGGIDISGMNATALQQEIGGLTVTELEPGTTSFIFSIMEPYSSAYEIFYGDERFKQSPFCDINILYKNVEEPFNFAVFVFNFQA